MRRALLILLVPVALVAGVVAWRVWPRDPGPVAPPMTAREVAIADRHIDGDVSLLPGGSRSEAHRLWVRYHDQVAYQGVKPRLLGVSPVHISSGVPNGIAPTGDYWIVFCDRAWQPSLGGQDGSPGGYSREIVLVPEGSRSTSGTIMLF